MFLIVYLVRNLQTCTVIHTPLVAKSPLCNYTHTSESVKYRCRVGDLEFMRFLTAAQLQFKNCRNPVRECGEREESGFHAEKKKKAKYRLDSNRARFRQWSGLWSCRGRGRTEMFCHLSTPPLVCAHRPPHYFWQELYSKLTSSLDTVCLQSIRPWKTAN